jgi:Kef-type K+ transport system membrane component KefB
MRLQFVNNPCIFTVTRFWNGPIFKRGKRNFLSYLFLLKLCIILVSTKVLSLLTGKVQMPQVVGSLLAGLLLGPAVLGTITQALWGTAFCLQPSDFLNQLAELGVIVIMFSAGMGTSVDDLKSSGVSGFLVALIGVLVPLGMGTLLMRLFEPSASIMSDVFLGTVLTATSVSITVETLKEIGKLNTKVGNTILAAALIDDVLGLICLTIVSSLAGAQVNILVVLLKILLFFVFVGIMGVLFYKFMVWYDKRVHDRNLHRFPIAAFALCLFMAWAAEAIFGVADIIGAFSAGMIVAMTPKGQYIAGKFAPVSYLLLTPIFFANIGLKVTLPKMSGTFVLFTVCLVLVGRHPVQARGLRPRRQDLRLYEPGKPADRLRHGLPRRGRADRGQPGHGHENDRQRLFRADHHSGRLLRDLHADHAEGHVPRRGQLCGPRGQPSGRQLRAVRPGGYCDG